MWPIAAVVGGYLGSVLATAVITLQVVGSLAGASPDTTDAVPDTTPDACGPDGVGICEWVYDTTGGNETIAKAADWLIGRPLLIVAVVVGAWVLRVVARWLIRRGVRRMMVPPAAVQKGMIALGAPELDSVEQEIDQARRFARAESIGRALAGVAAALIWASAAVTILSIIGFELGPLIAGAGIVGVAVGFGAQSLVRDGLNGVFILIEDQYGIGDFVDLGAASGTVEEVSLRTTILRGGDGTVWHVPNGEIRRVGNLSQMWSMAVLDVQVARDADIDLARRLLGQVATELFEDPAWSGDVLAAPQVLGVEAVEADSITLRLHVKTTPGRQWAVQRELRERIKPVVDQAGIGRRVILRPDGTAFSSERPPG
jgi:small-conductance mechanosensitive channel